MKGLATFLGGLAVGTLVGILIAPDKGTATRDRIKDCLRKRGILPSDEIDILIEEITSNPEARFDEATREEQPDKPSETNKAEKK